MSKPVTLAIRAMSFHRGPVPTVIMCVLIGILTGAAPARAQQPTGSIAGRIVDEQGNGLTGAAVTARHTDTGFLREVTADPHGL